MIREAIAKLMNKEDLTYDEARGVMEEMMDGTATQAQMGGFLTALSMQGETIEEITVFATVMREKGVKITPEREVIDIVGTGRGSGWDFKHLDNIRICRSSRWRAGCKTRQPERIKQKRCGRCSGKAWHKCSTKSRRK